MDLAGPEATASERLKYRKIGMAFDAKDAELALANERIRELEAQVERMKAKKRRAIPNPNQKFIQLGDFLGGNRKPPVSPPRIVSNNRYHCVPYLAAV
jgi:hypothetical protein